MLAITLGYQANGNTAEPIPLYTGRDAAKAFEIATNPPEGIVRTELFKNPTVTKRYQAPAAGEVVTPESVAEPAAPAEEPSAPAEETPEAPSEEDPAPAPAGRGRRS